MSEADAVLAEVNGAHGAAYRVLRPLTGGYQGHAFVIGDPSGRAAVLKWGTKSSWAPQVLRASSVVARVREAGWPTPAWLHVGVTRAGFPYQVQEFVEGSPMSRLGPVEVDLLLTMVDLQVDLDPDPQRGWSPFIYQTVFDNRDGSREAVRASGPAGAAVVEEFMRLYAPLRGLAIPDSDLVHGDLSTANVLVANGAIAGAVDVEQLGSGTRAADLAALWREGYSSSSSDPVAVARLRHAGEAVAGPEVFRLCVAAGVFTLAKFVLDNNPAVLAANLAEALEVAAALG